MDTKEDMEATNAFDITAKVTVTRAYQLPMAKLTVSGTINESLFDSTESKVAQRAIIFVIDRSYSMMGERISMVKDALTPFIQSMSNDENTIVKLVLFNNKVQIVELNHSTKHNIQEIIRHNVYASGGTNFHECAKGIVTEASLILKQHPNHQLTVIMCSDGEVSKDNAAQGHSHWKQFVNESYLKVHKTVPYVETIGISTAHDADVLDGFIVDDVVGNYCKCNQVLQIKEAFQRAQDSTMARRNATRLSIEFSLNVSDHIYATSKQSYFHVHDLIVTSQTFATNYWIAMNALDQTTKGGDVLQIRVNGIAVKIDIEQVTNDEECQYEAIGYYNVVLRDMLHTLRNITDAQRLKAKAKEIEHELNDKYAEIFKKVTAEPVDKVRLQNEIKELLRVDHQHTFGDEDNMSKRRAQLMKQYKQMNKSWRKYHVVCKSFQHTLASLKALVREIILGQVRIQEIRQHILDLHFRKKHAKRMEKLILSDEQLSKRQAIYDNIVIPKENECKDITDEIGTGCYLSTCSFREIAIEGDSLWMTARVSRKGGVAVSNPELVQIEYISSDLVSDPYFRMALEAASNDNDEKQMDNIAFADSSRQLINARIFPIYGNEAHFKASAPYIKEILSHTLSGRNDIHVVDYNALWTCLGYMICNNSFTTKNVKRILFEMKPSLKMLSEYIKCKPFKENSYAREPDTNATYFITLAQKKRTRICKYIETFRARTTAWVSEVSTLFADRLMNVDVVFDEEFYLSAIVHRLRIMFNLQAPKHMEDMSKIKVNENHKKLLQILICGDGTDDDDDNKEQSTIDGDESITFLHNVYTNKILKQKKLFAVPQNLKPVVDFSKKDNEIIEKWNAKEIKASTKKLLVSILSRMDARRLIKGHSFFETLSNMKDEEDADKCCDEFMKQCKYKNIDKIPNDLNLLFNEIGWKINVNVLRAICCISILFHRNKAWHDNVHWFGDDVQKQIINHPESVLKRVYGQFVIKSMRYDYKMYIERENMKQLREIHTNPILPDDLDQNGELPYLRCGWKRCGQIFQNRDQLLNHVRFALYGDSRPLLHGFHGHCKYAMRDNRHISLSNFKKKVRTSFKNTKYAKYMKLPMYDMKMEHYYKHFEHGSVLNVRTQLNHQSPDIISYGNMYYFDQLCSIRKHNK